MRIKPKISLFTSIFLVVAIAVLTFLNMKNIQNQGEEKLQTYKKEAINSVKSHLKDLVDVAYETIDKNYNNLSDLRYLSDFYERRLHDIVNTGETIINRYKKQVKTGKMTLATAKKSAMNEIRELRFDGGTGYLWINDTTTPYPRMVMHPTVPDLEGKILDDPKFNNAQGIDRNLFVAFLNVTQINGNDGFVDYLWPKPTEQGLTEEVPKLSYVRRYDDWGWILGTGIYIDDAQSEIENSIKASIKSMRYAEGTGYFWINDDAEPFPRMVMHPTVPDLDDEILNDPKYNNALGVDKNLFVAFREVTKTTGEGFVDYLWPKPTPSGLSERTEKISYVKLHKGLGWIIGSGAYIDNIDADVARKKEEINDQITGLLINTIIISLIFIVLAVIVSFVFSKSLSSPIIKLTKIAEEISKGKNLSQPISEINRDDEIGELAKSVDRLKASVKIMIDRMTKKK